MDSISFFSPFLALQVTVVHIQFSLASHFTKIYKAVTYNSRCHCSWPKCFNIFWSFAFGIVGIFFLCADLAAEAIDNTRALSLRYACEDVPHYYAHVDQMEGAALLKELNSIVSGHQSLSYKEVRTNCMW